MFDSKMSPYDFVNWYLKRDKALPVPIYDNIIDMISYNEDWIKAIYLVYSNQIKLGLNCGEDIKLIEKISDFINFVDIAKLSFENNFIDIPKVGLTPFNCDSNLDYQQLPWNIPLTPYNC